jgi:hypothetical protein
MVKQIQIQEHEIRPSGILDYYVTVRNKQNKFVTGWRFQGYSGTAVHDEVKFISKSYPEHKGYKIVW